MTRDYGQGCPIARTLDLIGERWTMLILRDLFLDATKFKEFREHSPGMPTKILSDRLKALERHGLIQRRVYSEHPLRAEYHLTALGRSLEPVLAAVYAWGMTHAVSPAERLASRRRVAASGAPPDRLAVRRGHPSTPTTPPPRR
jgi:DNA-binding HxlR family transcriptional regulator